MATKTYNARTLLVAAKPRNKRLREIGYQGGSSATVDVDLTPYLLKATFDDLFEKVNIGTDSNPKWSIKAKYGLWTEQFLSAKGVGTDSESGGGIDYEAVQEMIAEALQGYNPSTGSIDWDSITGKPDVFAPSAHSHAIANVTGLQTALDGKVPTTRTITAGTGLTGGGTLAADRTISLNATNVGLLQMLSDMFEWQTVGGVQTIKAKASLWTEGYLSAKGVEGEQSGGSALDDVWSEIDALGRWRDTATRSIDELGGKYEAASGEMEVFKRRDFAILDHGVLKIVHTDAHGTQSMESVGAGNVGARPSSWLPSKADIEGLGISVPWSNVTGKTARKFTVGGVEYEPFGAADKSFSVDVDAATGTFTIGSKTFQPYSAKNKPTSSDVGARPSTWTPTATDVGVPAWAQADTKPTYTASEVGARPNTWTPSAADVGVPAWAQAATKPTYTAAEVGARPSTWTPTASDVGADPAGTAASAASAAETAAKNYANGLLQIGNGSNGGKLATLKIQLNGTDVDTYSPLATSTKTINVAGVLTTGNYSSYVTKAYIDGLGVSAATATKLQTPRTIFGCSFDGSGDIAVNAAGTMQYLNFRNAANTGTASYIGTVSAGSDALHMTTFGESPIYFFTNSIARLTISAGGNIGLGVSSPTMKLDVAGGMRATDHLYMTHDAPSIFLRSGKSGPYITSSDTNLLLCWHDSTDVWSKTMMAVGSEGNVGIGTTSPAYKLDVNGSARVADVLYFKRHDNDSDTGYIGRAASSTSDIHVTTLGENAIYFMTNSATRMIITAAGNVTMNGYAQATSFRGSYLQCDTTNGALFGDAASALGNGNTGAVMWAYGNNPLRLYTNSVNRMHITGGGDVGIGTSSPACKLDVNGSARIADVIYFKRHDNDNNTGYIGRAASSTSDIYVATQGENAINFSTNSAVRMSIAAGGNVGIGTTSPDAKLHVAGAVHATVGVRSDGYLSGKATTSSSDMRLKDVQGACDLTTEQVAAAPSFLFRYKADPSMLYVGSSAQYWQDALPESVLEIGGTLHLDYAKLATASVIAVARRELELERRVQELEDEVERLRRSA